MRKSKPSRLHCIFVAKTIDSVIKWCFSEGKHRNNFWRIITGVAIKKTDFTSLPYATEATSDKSSGSHCTSH